MRRLFVVALCLVSACKERPEHPIGSRLVVSLHAASDSIVVGAAQQFRLDVTNRSGEAIDAIVYGGTFAFDLSAKDQTDREVWRRSRQEIGGYGQHLRLAPGASTSFEATWDARDNAGRPVAVGTYRLTGYLVDDGANPLAQADAIARVRVVLP